MTTKRPIPTTPALEPPRAVSARHDRPGPWRARSRASRRSVAVRMVLRSAASNRRAPRRAPDHPRRPSTRHRRPRLASHSTPPDLPLGLSQPARRMTSGRSGPNAGSPYALVAVREAARLALCAVLTDRIRRTRASPVSKEVGGTPRPGGEVRTVLAANPQTPSRPPHRSRAGLSMVVGPVRGGESPRRTGRS